MNQEKNAQSLVDRSNMVTIGKSQNQLAVSYYVVHLLSYKEVHRRGSKGLKNAKVTVEGFDRIETRDPPGLISHPWPISLSPVSDRDSPGTPGST